jgi:DNA-binding MarR family transcriptional regulator
MSDLDGVSLPVLLRAARNVYSDRLRAALAQAGCDDIPRNGLYVLGAIAHAGTPLQQIIRNLGVSKQAAGQLLDALVLRGYLERNVDPEDRRRLTVHLTVRGRHAADTAAREADAIRQSLVEEVGEKRLADAQEVLMALIDGHARRWPGREER